MTPLWIWALGRYYTEDNPDIEIPVVNVFASLAVVIIPVSLGVALNHYNRDWGNRVAQLLKPFTGLVGVAFIGLGTASYMYALERAVWQQFVSCILLSFLGYTIAFTVGKLIMKENRQAITISLETGFQNLALAILMLGISLPSPESDMAGTMPIIYTFTGASFPSIAFLAKLTHRVITTGRCTSPDDSFEVTDENEAKTNDEEMLKEKNSKLTDGVYNRDWGAINESYHM